MAATRTWVGGWSRRWPVDAQVTNGNIMAGYSKKGELVVTRVSDGVVLFRSLAMGMHKCGTLAARSPAASWSLALTRARPRCNIIPTVAIMIFWLTGTCALSRLTRRMIAASGAVARRIVEGSRGRVHA